MHWRVGNLRTRMRTGLCQLLSLMPCISSITGFGNSSIAPYIIWLHNASTHLDDEAENLSRQLSDNSFKVMPVKKLILPNNSGPYLSAALIIHFLRIISFATLTRSFSSTLLKTSMSCMLSSNAPQRQQNICEIGRPVFRRVFFFRR